MAIETTYITNGNGAAHAATDQADWTEAVAQIHLRLLQDMDLAAVERLDPERARGAVQGATGTGILAVDKLPWETHAALLDEVVNVIGEFHGKD